jgi:hypothetical protein
MEKHRFLWIMHAQHALYHLSYIPMHKLYQGVGNIVVLNPFFLVVVSFSGNSVVLNPSFCVSFFLRT